MPSCFRIECFIEIHINDIFALENHRTWQTKRSELHRVIGGKWQEHSYAEYAAATPDNSHYPKVKRSNC